jgi:hypothetical protein
MKLPYMQFYVADYLVDTAPLSLAAQGAWMRVLCALHSANPRGTRSMSLEAWARYLSVTPDVTACLFQELMDVGVCENVTTGNASVTLTCRRMLREDVTKEQTRIRVRNHRLAGKRAGKNAAGNNGGNASGNADVTDKKSEVRSQKSDKKAAPSTAGAVSGDAQDSSVLPPVPKPRNVLLDTLATIGGGKPEEVPSGRWSAVNKCLTQIKAVCPDLTTEEIGRRAANYRTHFRDAMLTPEALTKHWATCASAKNHADGPLFHDGRGEEGPHAELYRKF